MSPIPTTISLLNAVYVASVVEFVKEAHKDKPFLYITLVVVNPPVVCFSSWYTLTIPLYGILNDLSSCQGVVVVVDLAVSADILAVVDVMLVLL